MQEFNSVIGERNDNYIYRFLFNSDYMVTKLKEDGLDNVHTEAAQVGVTLSQKGHAIQLNLIPEDLILSLYLSLYKACFPMFHLSMLIKFMSTTDFRFLTGYEEMSLP